jgi:hypothetical protein
MNASFLCHANTQLISTPECFSEQQQQHNNNNNNTLNPNFVDLVNGSVPPSPHLLKDS